MKKGFTLVELLVVIAIIAILSVVGLTVFSGIQDRARDAKIRQDIQAIANALETRYDEGTGTYPDTVTGSMFAEGRVPTQPDGTQYTITGLPDCYTVTATLSDGSTYSLSCQQE